MSVLSAKNVILFRQVNQSWQAFAYSTSCEVELSVELSDVSTGAWAERRPKSLSWGMRGSFLVPSVGRDVLESHMLSAEKLLCRMSSVSAHAGTVTPTGYSEDNQLVLQGYCVITNMSLSAGNGQKAGVSLAMKGSGALSPIENALKVSVLVDGVKVKATTDHSVTDAVVSWTISFKDPTTGVETTLSVTDLDSLVLNDGTHSVAVTTAISQLTWPYAIAEGNRIVTATAVYRSAYRQEDSCTVKFNHLGRFGTVDSSWTLTASAVDALQQVTITQEAHTQSAITMSNRRIVFARPDRPITTITDGAGQVQTDGFDISDVTISGTEYHVAVQRLPSSVSGYQLTFS